MSSSTACHCDAVDTGEESFPAENPAVQACTQSTRILEQGSFLDTPIHPHPPFPTPLNFPFSPLSFPSSSCHQFPSPHLSLLPSSPSSSHPFSFSPIPPPPFPDRGWRRACVGGRDGRLCDPLRCPVNSRGVVTHLPYWRRWGRGGSRKEGRARGREKRGRR